MCPRFMKTDKNIAANPEPGVQTEDFAERVRVNQTYVLGHSQREIQRLISQAAMLRPVTERLLTKESEHRPRYACPRLGLWCRRCFYAGCRVRRTNRIGGGN